MENKRIVEAYSKIKVPNVPGIIHYKLGVVFHRQN